MAAVEYISDLVAELEVNGKEERIKELGIIEKAVTDTVKKNVKEVRAEMQRIFDCASDQAQSDKDHQVLTVGALQQALGDLQLHGAASPLPQGHPPNQNQTSKLTLRYGHILEDINDFQWKLASEMSDPEVTYYMREMKNWTKKVDDMVSSNRKFQEEALGIEDL